MSAASVAVMLWWSRQRVRLNLYCGFVFMVVTWVGSYILWLAQACMAFLPFVSDFAGGLSGPLFMWGMSAAALALMPTWFDYYLAITSDESKVGGACWRCLHKCVPIVGVLCSISILGVAMNPWHLRFIAHLLAATGIFYGSGLLLLLDSLLGWKRGESFKRVLCVALLAFTSLVLMTVFGARAGSALEAKGAEIYMGMLGTDFHGYCTGAAGSLHYVWECNVCAMFEWLLLSFVSLAAFWKLVSVLG